jgi:hypothetical protein
VAFESTIMVAKLSSILSTSRICAAISPWWPLANSRTNHMRSAVSRNRGLFWGNKECQSLLAQLRDENTWRCGGFPHMTRSDGLVNTKTPFSRRNLQEEDRTAKTSGWSGVRLLVTLLENSIGLRGLYSLLFNFLVHGIRGITLRAFWRAA